MLKYNIINCLLKIFPTSYIQHRLRSEVCWMAHHIVWGKANFLHDETEHI
jgi:hypothetical protein